MKYYKNIVLTLLLVLTAISATAAERHVFNKAWRFHDGDVEKAFMTAYDDLSWRLLDLPHDWAFENGYAEDGAQGDRGGYASGGIGWYRKHFSISKKELLGKRFHICFDGVYMNSDVWINGHHLGKRPYGYVSFSYELTPFLREGNNVIAVRVDNSLEPSARWYHGCGIYADVYLQEGPMVDFEQNSIYVTTPELTEDQAGIHVKAALDAGKTGDTNHLRISCRIFSPEGNVLVSRKNIAPSEMTAGLDFRLDHPKIWDVDNPSLYTLELSIIDRCRRISSEKIRFGIRTMAWDPETGFYLNGKVLKLQGVCEHLEGGPVGAAWTRDLLRWKLQLLKQMGCNAIRTAHNPQVPFFYDLCDEIGLLVMDEVFDGWRTKAKFDYGHQAFAEWWERDLRATIRRDRNHPSVILYSVGNETKGDVASVLVRVCHEEDSSRLVTSGHSGSEFMDVVGINGHSEKKTFIETYKPEAKAFIGTETPHTWQVRGYYRSRTWYRDGYPNRKQSPFYIQDMTEKEIFTYDWAGPEMWKNKKQHLNSSYDNATVRLSSRHNIEFLRDIHWYSGSFRWTGFDYLGEAGYVHGGWPFRAFMGGALDMAGFQKDLYYLYQAEWTQTPVAHILPHWTHPYMKEGTEVPVVVYTNGDTAELFVNGESLGKRTKGSSWSEMALQWMVPWKEGRLEVRSYKNGELWASASQKTAGAPSVLSISTQNLTTEQQDLTTVILDCAEKDSEGTLYPYGENRVYFQVPEMLNNYSLENGNPTDVETNFNADSKTAFFGLLRGFFRFSSKQKQPVLRIGSILGDKKLKINDLVSIDVQSVNLLTGKCFKENWEIRYTLDGSRPSPESALYEGPFSVKPGTSVRASVYLAGEIILDMQESFGPHEGIWWAEEGESNVFSLRGIQAENVSFTGMEKSTELAGFDGDCHLLTVSPEAHLSYYQENDGSARKVPLELSYYHQNGRFTIRVTNNGKQVAAETIEGTPSYSWLNVAFQIPLTNGANQIDITIAGDPGNGIDWFDLSE